MGIKQVNKLYNKIVHFDDVGVFLGKIDKDARTRIFQKIMDDVDRLIKKIKRYDRDSREYKDLDKEIRGLLLKEIQVIIDEYVIAERSGKLKKWQNKYGDIKQYMNNFYMFRDSGDSQNRSPILENYGFFIQEN